MYVCWTHGRQGLASWQLASRRLCIQSTDCSPTAVNRMPLVALHASCLALHCIALHCIALLLLLLLALHRLLTPDHGYPVRLLVPGTIGGRSVKWLSSIHVSSEDTLNYHHINDNRLLPESVDGQKAEEGGYFDPHRWESRGGEQRGGWNGDGVGGSQGKQGM